MDTGVSHRSSTPASLPGQFADWFAARGWQPRSHQLDMLETVSAGHSALLIAPTGGGKTLAGFLPSLIELAQGAAGKGLHTLYVSPLKALAVDITRNLETPIRDMGLDIRIEVRTGDTPSHKRQRQKTNPPDILITTPEQVSLLITQDGAEHYFANLRVVILDELHSMVPTKRGCLLALALARLHRFAPGLKRIGLSATVASPDTLRAWLMPQDRDEAGVEHMAAFVCAPGGAEPDISIMRCDGEVRMPWSGHTSAYALPDIYEAVKSAGMALVFTNTRSQAERIFHELWTLNEDALPIALHHGSLDVSQRRKVEAAMAAGSLRAVVCTSTLDLGIDWGDVDLVINVGAPKGSSRILQRIGRANHRYEEPSRALLVPSNRFEVLECEAARVAAFEGAQDGEGPAELKRDVLAQHIMGSAVAAPFDPDELYAEIISAWPYRNLTREDFGQAVDFVATGGYALKTYERFARLKQMPDGRMRLTHPRLAQSYRMNAGTIVEAEMLKVKLAGKRRSSAGKPLNKWGGKVLGEVEEWFVEQLRIGDTFLFAGQILRLEAIEELNALVSRADATEPMIPSYQGGKFPLSTYLAGRVRAMLAEPVSWQYLPEQVRDWLKVQQWKSVLPQAHQMLVETFPKANKHYLVCYPFDGRLAHQTLGMLLTRRLERAGMQPLGFVCNDYALSVWCVRDVSLAIETGRLSLAQLFDQDMLGDDLDAWLAESMLMKRTFRTCAIIAGLIERRWPGQEKSGRQMTVSADLIYDVLRTHQPDHWLLKAAWDDAASGLIDAKRLAMMLARIKGNIIHKALEQVSPLAVPVMLEIGREPVYGEAHDALLAEAADDLVDEAMRLV
ncbi:MAG: ligase-associated DNA damage response DEXH box helicase [Anderseniella sp.]|nr:ligase-associated DNA damage response DEXH box helicase [Anderseniella sp.]